MLYFRVACATKISNEKRFFFVLLAYMECCYQSVKILEEIIRSKYQCASRESIIFHFTLFKNA